MVSSAFASLILIPEDTSLDVCRFTFANTGSGLAQDKEVGRMESAHGASYGEEHLTVVAADIGQQFVDNVVEPSFLLFDAPAFVATLI